ncbi:hypothetical protein [Psychrobacter sp. ANT_WB68]|uniref:hypothetical protein n=1 Tax=Psychrobacter sp. ANT_WB68 TaxID=2597355 RepID=UPI0011F3B461|nr:hypothetical protein [Psychrobacter sp. ANT_WB68]KAA0914287.1 hypothetical protein FQ084_06860 [Psychrobacter sp. ANT_WB68]
MPALATTHSLNDYLKLPISRYREQLRQGNAQSIEVSYTHRSKPYQYSIQLTKTSCNYGGNRYWWLCPKCYQRTSTLYCAGLYVCRHCIGANYGSQLQQPIDRIYSNLNALRERLGWQVGIIHGIGERPKGMHHSTYERLLVEYEQLTNKLIRTFY